MDNKSKFNNLKSSSINTNNIPNNFRSKRFQNSRVHLKSVNTDFKTNSKKDLPSNYHDDSKFVNQYSSNPKNSFFNNVFSNNGFYKYIWFPILLLITTIAMDFILQILLYKINPSLIPTARNSLFFNLLLILFICSNFSAFIYLGYKGAKDNFRYKNITLTVLKFAFCFFIIELILTIVSVFTFMGPYISYYFGSSLYLKYSYLGYLLLWNLIKYVVYLFTYSVSFLLFSKSKDY
ncbi:MAG: hypothetical protein V1824_01180 [archaeon]